MLTHGVSGSVIKSPTPLSSIPFDSGLLIVSYASRTAPSAQKRGGGLASAPLRCASLTRMPFDHQKESKGADMEIKFDTEKKVVNSEVVFTILSEVLQAEDGLDRDKEHLWAIGLTSQNQIKYIDLVHLGAVNQCPCNPMEIFRRACINGVTSIIVAHNHPSGSPKPSNEDRLVTKRLVEAGSVLGIKFMDHLIIGRNGFYSFSDEGEIPSEPVVFWKGGAPRI